MQNETQTIATDKKGRLAQVLSPSLVALLQSAPTNDVIRTQVLAVIKQPLPNEAQTYEAIVAWIEANIEPKSDQALSPSFDNEEAVVVEVTITERCRGTADFRGLYSGHDTLAFSARTLLREAQDVLEQGRGFDGLLEALADKIYDSDLSADELDDDTTEYDNHEVTCSGNTNITFSLSWLAERVRAWLAECAPEVLRELDEE